MAHVVPTKMFNESCIAFYKYLNDPAFMTNNCIQMLGESISQNAAER